ncbi:MAG TPA: helix-turn-helix domain-containing protein [Verrucomicrobiota bacterium]|nr:AraC family transcriptional regulator [Verrucomicrobiales bacterium]HRI13280.1 helix-turn-helix domain-containing protein [Verrucomicrobiota bacterium]
MTFASHIPGPPLNDFVEQFWYYDGLNVPHSRERVLPDGTFQLMINLRDEPRTLFDREHEDRSQDFRRAWVSGAHREYIVIDARPGSSLIGIHFKPGGATPFLGLPAIELRDRVIELDSLMDSAVNDLRDALLEAPTPQDKFRILEKFLWARAGGRPVRSPAVALALRRFQEVPHTATMESVAQELGISHKHFIARFHAEVGLTPKRYCRIRRFQQVLAGIERKVAVDWADLAYACGYYDQAHFIQEFHDFSGLRPTAYLRERGDYLGFVPLGG